MPKKAKCEDKTKKFYKSCDACCDKKETPGKYSKKDCVKHCPDFQSKSKKWQAFLATHLGELGSRKAVAEKYKETKQEKRPPSPFALFVQKEHGAHKEEIDKKVLEEKIKRGPATMKVLGEKFKDTKKKEEYKTAYDLSMELIRKAKETKPKRDPSPFAKFVGETMKGKKGMKISDVAQMWKEKKQVVSEEPEVA